MFRDFGKKLQKGVKKIVDQRLKATEQLSGGNLKVRLSVHVLRSCLSLELNAWLRVTEDRMNNECGCTLLDAILVDLHLHVYSSFLSMHSAVWVTLIVNLIGDQRVRLNSLVLAGHSWHQ